MNIRRNLSTFAVAAEVAEVGEADVLGVAASEGRGGHARRVEGLVAVRQAILEGVRIALIECFTVV